MRRPVASMRGFFIGIVDMVTDDRSIEMEMNIAGIGLRESGKDKERLKESTEQSTRCVGSLRVSMVATRFFLRVNGGKVSCTVLVN